MEEEVAELLGREKAERRSAHSWRAVPHNHLHHSFIGSSKITQDRSTVDICAARAATPSSSPLKNYLSTHINGKDAWSAGQINQGTCSGEF